MSEIILNYISGQGAGWSIPSNAFDGDAGVYASITLSSFAQNLNLTATGNDNVLTSGDISKVELGVTAFCDGDTPSAFVIYYSPPLALMFKNEPTPVTKWLDISSQKSSWEFSDIDDLDISSWAWANYFGTTNFYVSRFMLKVQYEPSTEEGYTNKVNGVQPVSVNGIKNTEIKNII